MALIFREANYRFRDKVKEMECRDGRRKKERPESISDEDAAKKRLDVGELGAALRSLVSRADEDEVGGGARWTGQRLSIEQPREVGQQRGDARQGRGGLGHHWSLVVGDSSSREVAGDRGEALVGWAWKTMRGWIPRGRG